MRLTIAPNVPLETQLGCFGYFGFGSGVALARFGPSSDGGPLYCQADKCSRAPACWDRHRARTRVIFPGMTELADEVAKTHQGPAYVLELTRRAQELAPGTMAPDQCHEPYLLVMMGNMEDGGRIASGAPPMNRGHEHGRLTWPLERLEP